MGYPCVRHYIFLIFMVKLFSFFLVYINITKLLKGPLGMTSIFVFSFVMK